MTEQTITIPPITVDMCEGTAVLNISIGITISGTCGGNEGGGGGGSDWLPTGAVAYADFVNGNYYAGGAVTTAAAMFQEDTQNWGNTFDLANIVPTVGYVSSGTEGGDQDFAYLGDALASVIAGATAVYEFDATSVANCTAYIDVLSLDFSTLLSIAASAGGTTYTDNAAISGSTGALVEGLNRIAFTASAGRLAVSINGAPAVGGDSPVWANVAWADVDFGNGYAEGATMTLKSLTIYEPKNDAALSALSALA